MAITKEQLLALQKNVTSAQASVKAVITDATAAKNSLASAEKELAEAIGSLTTQKMIVGLDAGGWGPTEWPDVAGAAKFVRLGVKLAPESEVDAMAKAGVGICSVIFGENGTIGAINPTAYANEIVAWFKKFGKGGTFWQGKTDLGCQAVEVLNEWNGSWFWTDSTNYTAYVGLCKAVHEALATNFPETIRPKVLAGYGNQSSWQGIAKAGVAQYIDGVVEHPYGGANRETGGILGDRAQVERAHNESGKPIYITEIGWPTEKSTGDSALYTEAEQADAVAKFYAWAKSTGYIVMVTLYGYVGNYGIERRNSDGSKGPQKPSYASLAAASNS